ncbi:hypothetical protein B0H14DRAFT_2691060 [Mycena olivaceomarginata]|nr:hypothetical protein B0H14DRAFT_2691060 [Mycena olivaceomarginata]
MNDGLNYGHGAAMAFATYSNPVFLEYAKQVWWAVKTYTLSQSELDTGTASLKNISLTPTCQGLTMIGGTFREKAPTAPNINTLSTGGFLVCAGSVSFNHVTFTDTVQSVRFTGRNHWR